MRGVNYPKSSRGNVEKTCFCWYILTWELQYIMILPNTRQFVFWLHFLKNLLMYTSRIVFYFFLRICMHVLHPQSVTPAPSISGIMNPFKAGVTSVCTRSRISSFTHGYISLKKKCIAPASVLVLSIWFSGNSPPPQICTSSCVKS